MEELRRELEGLGSMQGAGLRATHARPNRR